MLFIDIFRLSKRVFKTNKLRTLLTILGIGVGIGAVLFLVSLGYGLQRTLLSQIATSDTLLSLDISSEDSSIIELNQKNLKIIGQIPEVEEVSPLLNIPSQMMLNELTGDVFVNAIEPSYFKLSGIEANQGKIFSSDGKNEIVVSSAVLKLFNIADSQNALEMEAKFNLFIPKAIKGEKFEGVEEIEIIQQEEPFEIIGVIKDDDVSYAYAPVQSFEELNLDKFNSAKIKVFSQEGIEGAREKIIEMGFMVSALSDTLKEANQIFKAIQIILALFGIVALVVSAIGMFNTMTIALLERTQEIGIMKILGATNKDIWKLFLTESIMIGLFGGLSGVAIGLLGGEFFNYGINLLAQRLGGEALDLFYSPIWFIAFIILFSTVVGSLTGLYPARRASRLNALDALRYK